MRREKSLHRSDSFQTRQQFARETAVSLGYTSYAAALTGQPQAQIPIQQGAHTGYNPVQQGYLGYHMYSAPAYPPSPVVYPFQPMSTASSRDAPSSHPESGTSSPATVRNDSPGFQPNPFAREFVPTGASSGGSGIRPPPPVRPKDSTTPPVVTPTTPATIATTSSRHSTPPAVAPTQQVKKTASFENNSAARPITPSTQPIYRSQSASSMRPQPQQQYPAYPLQPPYMIPQLPVPPPMLSTPPQRDWGPPLTTGTIRYMANGQPSTLFHQCDKC